MPRLTATYNIVINQGATFRLPMKLWGEDESDPIDLTGCVAALQVRRAPGMEVITEFSTENGKITIIPDEGSILLELDAEETANLIPQQYYYDLLIKNGEDGDTMRLMEGAFTVKPAVTFSMFADAGGEDVPEPDPEPPEPPEPPIVIEAPKAFLVVGTSTAGWTEDDCDYLCDGTDDQEEINQAIQDLPEVYGGTVLILEGEYDITASIIIDKDNVKLCGQNEYALMPDMYPGILPYPPSFLPPYEDVTILNGNAQDDDFGEGRYGAFYGEGTTLAALNALNTTISQISFLNNSGETYDNINDIQVSNCKNITFECCHFEDTDVLIGFCDGVCLDHNVSNKGEHYVVGLGATLCRDVTALYNSAGIDLNDVHGFYVLGNESFAENGDEALGFAFFGSGGQIDNNETDASIKITDYSTQETMGSISANGNTCHSLFLQAGEHFIRKTVITDTLSAWNLAGGEFVETSIIGDGPRISDYAIDMQDCHWVDFDVLYIWPDTGNEPEVGIRLWEHCTGIRMSRTAIDNAACGLWIQEAKHCLVSQPYITAEDIGVKMEGVQFVEVTEADLTVAGGESLDENQHTILLIDKVEAHGSFKSHYNRIVGNLCRGKDVTVDTVGLGNLVEHNYDDEEEWDTNWGYEIGNGGEQ